MTQAEIYNYVDSNVTELLNNQELQLEELEVISDMLEKKFTADEEQKTLDEASSEASEQVTDEGSEEVAEEEAFDYEQYLIDMHQQSELQTETLLAINENLAQSNNYNMVSITMLAVIAGVMLCNILSRYLRH